MSAPSRPPWFQDTLRGGRLEGRSLFNLPAKAADVGAQKWKGRDSAPAMSGTRAARPTYQMKLPCHMMAWWHGDQFYVTVMAQSSVDKNIVVGFSPQLQALRANSS